MKQFSLFLIIATVLLFASELNSAPGLKIDRAVIGSGGMLEVKNSSNLKLSGLVGQVAIDRISQGNRVLYQGFWVPLESPTGVDENPPISLNNEISNFPNPASTTTTFRYNLTENSFVTLKVYDMVGNLIKTLVDGFQSAGQQEIVWDLKSDNLLDVPSGNYFYELSVSPAQIAGINDSRSKTYRNILVIVK
jgi:hypothetical protein